MKSVLWRHDVEYFWLLFIIIFMWNIVHSTKQHCLNNKKKRRRCTIKQKHFHLFSYTHKKKIGKSVITIIFVDTLSYCKLLQLKFWWTYLLLYSEMTFEWNCWKLRCFSYEKMEVSIETIQNWKMLKHFNYTSRNNDKNPNIALMFQTYIISLTQYQRRPLSFIRSATETQIVAHCREL